MKKLTINIFLFLLVCLLCIILIIIYIKPNEHLSLEASEIDVNEKIAYMVTNLKSEVILTEQDIDSLIKMQFDPNIADNLIVDGAHFYVENNQLHANLNVLYREKIAAQLHAQYSFELDEAGVMLIAPVSLKLKDIPLPTSLLEPIQFKIYDMKNSMLKITGIENKNRQLIIKWKLSLF